MAKDEMTPANDDRGPTCNESECYYEIFQTKIF